MEMLDWKKKYLQKYQPCQKTEKYWDLHTRSNDCNWYVFLKNSRILTKAPFYFAFICTNLNNSKNVNVKYYYNLK